MAQPCHAARSEQSQHSIRIDPPHVPRVEERPDLGCGRNGVKKAVDRLMVQRRRNGDDVHRSLVLRVGKASGEVSEEAACTAMVHVSGRESVGTPHRDLEPVT